MQGQLLNYSIQFLQRKHSKAISHFIRNVALFVIVVLLTGHNNIKSHDERALINEYATKTQSLIRLHISTPPDSINHISPYLEKLVSEFYEESDYLPAWTTNFSANYAFFTFKSYLDNSRYYGFPDDMFNLSLIETKLVELDQAIGENEHLEKRVEVELLFAKAVIKLLVYCNVGIIDEINEGIKKQIDEIPALLITSLKQNSVAQLFQNIQPQNESYKMLSKVTPEFLSLYDSIKYYSNVPYSDSTLAKALFYCNIIEAPVFDSSIQKKSALLKFQKRYKVAETSELDDTTHQLLVNQLEYKYYQICLNFDRLRKINSQNEDFLLVNIPEFKLHVFEKNSLKDSYLVIVGKTKTPTPILSSKIDRIIANPYWTVPRSIFNNEMLKKIRKDSTYLENHSYYIINNHEEKVDPKLVNWQESSPLSNKYWVRQKNNHKNALGQVKFLFPNDFSVYLHDTPSRYLFKKRTRAYSHGCVRVEHPEKLAQYLTNKLFSDSTNSTNFNAFIKTKSRKVVRLPKTIAIHISYLTALGNQGGELTFYKDIYKKDLKEIKTLFPNYGTVL